MTLDGNKLTHVQKIGADAATTVREFGATEMKATFSAKGVSATRVYKRL